MKTTNYLFILIFCFISITAEAQLSFGIRAAYVKSWMEYGDAYVPAGAIIHVKRFQVSAILEHPLNQHFSIGVEPGFTQRGAACFPGWNTFVGDTKLLLNYAELPVMMSAKIPVMNNRFELFGKGGFGVSRVITAYRHITNAGTGYPPENTKLDLDNSNLRKWDYGFYGGLGLGYKIGENRLFLDVNYYHGLKDVDKLNTSKNRSLQYGFGYTMNL